MRKGRIYKITNLIDGTVYIGQTIVDGNGRKRRHLYLLRNDIHTNPYLQNAYNKYGESNFKFEVVLHCSVDELDANEVRLISRARSNGKCYNIENGGRGRGAVDDSTRRKMSLITKSNHKEGTPYRENYLSSRVKKVICLNNMRVYEGIFRAAKELDLPRPSVQQVLNGNSNYAKGPDGTLYQFEYYQKDKEYKYHPIEENCRTSIKEVICLNTKERFSSVKEAAEKYNLSNNAILRCCRKVRRYGGRLENGDWFVWRFAEEYDEGEKVSFSRKGVNSHRSRPIVCTTTGERFQSITEACEKYKLSTGNLTDTLKGNRRYCGKLNNKEPLYWKYA